MNALSLHTNIQRRNSVYYIRVRVPADLLGYYAPKKEVVYSLKTKDPDVAKARGRIERLKVDQQFEDARRAQAKKTAVSSKSAPSSPALSPFEIERLALIHLHQTLAEDAAARMRPKSPEELETEREAYIFTDELQGVTNRRIPPFGMSVKEAARRRGRAELFLQALPAYIADNDLSIAEGAVDDLLASEGLEVPKNSPVYYQLCLSVLRAEKSAQEAILKRFGGELIETPDLTQKDARQSQGVSHIQPDRDESSTPSPENPPLSEVWRRYVQERKPVEKTVRDFGTAVRRFIEINGDLPIKAITKTHARIFKDTMLKLPARIPTDLRRLPVPKILERLKSREGDIQTLSPKTVNDKAISAISAIMSYAVCNGFIEVIPTAKIRATEVTSSSDPARLPYSIEDLNTIIGSPLFSGEIKSSALCRLPKKKEQREDYKWITLLALFTGARLEEIGQLDISDIGEEQGINFAYIHDDIETGRRIKNRGARRKVPLHNKLIELGFLKFVGERKKISSSGKIFYTLKSSTATLTAKFSMWWTKYGKYIGVYSKQKTFHSFRHSFKRLMRDAGVEKRLTDALQGHTEEKSVSDMYGRDEDGMMYSLATLNQALQKLTFDGVDFSGLKR